MVMAAVGISHRVELRRAIGQLRGRGLYAGAKWAAEVLVGLPEETPAEKAALKRQSRRKEPPGTGALNALREEDEEDDEDYGEKRKEEEIVELAGPLGRSDAVNEELAGLEQELSALYIKGTLDAFGSYLYGGSQGCALLFCEFISLELECLAGTSSALYTSRHSTPTQPQ
ncbi:unnamed protein product [Calypogeia fissa]